MFTAVIKASGVVKNIMKTKPLLEIGLPSLVFSQV
jgi:hypothetical protein